MPEQFQHYFPLTEEKQSLIWSKGAIVLDSNVYLHLYRLPKQEREELLMVLKNSDIGSRLWVPHQVAEEVFRGRLQVINDQTHSPDAFIRLADEALGKLISKLDSSVRKHHPFVSREEWKKKLHKLIEELRTDFESMKQIYPVSPANDPLLDELRGIFNGKVGEPFKEEEFQAAIKEGKNRIANKQPPGYKDSHKDGDRECGDYLIWAQILKEMASRKAPTVLVLDDAKEDWWLKSGGQRYGPRPELRRKYIAATGEEVVFASTEVFLKWAAKHIDLEHLIAIQEAIDESRFDAPTEPPPHFIRKSGRRPTSKQMVEWFLENYEDPANGVPYESSEGGYQYVFGGPYDACDVLMGEFPDASDRAIEKAVEEIGYEGGPEWVQVGNY